MFAYSEGVHTLGYLSDADYDFHIKRYSRGLAEERETEPQTFEQVKEKEELTKLEKMFAAVIEQWEIPRTPEWHQAWIDKATKHQDKVANARKLLEMVNPTER